MTVEQVADLLQLSPQTIYKWAAAKKLPSIKLGYMLRFEPDRISQWIEKREIGVRHLPHSAN